MIKAIIRVTFLALSLSLFLFATNPILKNDILKVEVTKRIQKMGTELFKKTGVNAYLIATNEHFPVGFNLVEYTKKYEDKLTKPYVVFVFAPFAKITEKIETRGRFGIIPSSKELAKYYDYDKVRDACLDVITLKDKNLIEDKHNIGVLQGYSELADDIASSKNIKLSTTIPNDMSTMVLILKILIYTGSFLVVWIFMLQPLYLRIKNGKK